MLRTILRFIAALVVTLPTLAAAEPITLKLSFFTSDRSQIYQNSIEPFVKAVNSEANGLIDIQVYFSGAISRSQAEQPKPVADGIADIALIVPRRTPERFPDTEVMALPGTAQLAADPRRQVVFPSPADLKRADEVFASVVENWAAASAHNREVLSLVKSEIAKFDGAK